MPLAKRYEVSADILSRESSKHRPQLQAVLRSMRKPIDMLEGIDAPSWHASVARARNAEQRRRGGVDDRPLPSWNFRAGVALTPLAPTLGAPGRPGRRCSSGTSTPAKAVRQDPSVQALQAKLQEQLQQQERLRRELQDACKQEDCQPTPKLEEQLVQLDDTQQGQESTPRNPALKRMLQRQTQGSSEQDENFVIEKQLYEQRMKQKQLKKQLEEHEEHLRREQLQKEQLQEQLQKEKEDHEEVLLEQQLQEQRVKQSQLRKQLQQEQEQELLEEHRQLDERLRQQLAKVQSQEQILLQLQQEALRLETHSVPTGPIGGLG